ncbi:restriction endonuclease subunit S [Caulobacter sp. 1776]|uniref:restriction endonuclease subunit S n=1 Tax=Caulobacter sp. 1776 TaxID=3156420 RepID=UPI00339A348F
MSSLAYPSYRDTGVEWLGAVPSHWQVTRLNSLFREVSEPGSDDLPVLSVSIHSGVSDTELADDEMDRVVARSEDRSKYKRVEPNDLVYNMMRAWQGGFGAVQTVGAVSPAYVVARPTSSQSTVFIERLLRTPNAVREMKSLSKGVTDFRLRLYWDEFKNIKVALPPPEEQVAIDAFLDRETAKIDALVEAQERLIVLLKEKRQAVISHAVTKGLDPSIPMKDSGVEWLGQVPAHWEVMPAKNLADSIKAGPFGSALTKDMYSSAGYRVYGQEQVIPGDFSIGDYYVSSDKYDELSQYRVEVGDLLVSCVGTFGKIAIFPQGAEPGIINPRLIRFRPNNQIDPTYLCVLLRSAVSFEQFSYLSRGGTMDVINIGILGEIMVPVPPMQEQISIAGYLAEVQEQFDSLSAASEAAITLLQERRAALIAAAVTGKIDVRGLVQTAEAA